MKVSFFLFVLVAACHVKGLAQSDAMLKFDKRKCGKALIDNGFLTYALRSNLDRLETQLIKPFDIYDDDCFRIAHIDAEELSEFNFDFFLSALNRILDKRGVKLSAQELGNDRDVFYALINGDTIQLYNQDDLESDAFWDTSSRNFFRKVNEILKAKDCDEQFYLLYGGNDLHVLLLTDMQFSIITSYYRDDEKERPYRP